MLCSKERLVRINFFHAGARQNAYNLKDSLHHLGLNFKRQTYQDKKHIVNKAKNVLESDILSKRVKPHVGVTPRYLTIIKSERQNNLNLN